MNNFLRTLGIIGGGVMGLSVFAAPPASINVHGQLIGSGGAVLSGERAYQVTFYDAATGGNVLGSALTGTVTVSASGLFNVAVTPPSEVLTASGVWYSVGVDTDVPADNDASDDVFPNRIRVYSVPFALQAQEVVAVDASRVGSGMVDNTELDALDGVTGNVQAQLDAIDTAAVMQHTTDIAANASAIATNTTNITTNATAIATKGDASTVSQNTTDIATNSSAIATNTTNITTNATTIATKGDASAVSQNATDIGTNATNIATNTTNIVSNTGSIATNTTNITTNATTIATKANSADVYTQTAADTAFVDAAGDTMSGTLGVDTITEATTDTGVTAEGLVLKDSYLGLPQIMAPGDTSDKLYNVSGTLFFGATQLGLSSLDKDGLNNAGTLGFDWLDSEVADGLTIQGGTVNNDSFSAYSDLTAESKIGTGASQVAAGNHAHAFSAITGSVTDAQVPDTISINGGTVNNNSFSALSDLNAESAIGTGALQVAAGNHAHAFSAITGSVTDAQVPNDITINGVDAADDTAGAPALTYANDSNTGIHRPGADQLAMVTNGAARLTVDNSEVNIAGNILEIASGSAPGVTTNKLYNTSGNLFWNGTQLDAGGSSNIVLFNDIVLVEGTTTEFFLNTGTTGFSVNVPSSNAFADGFRAVFFPLPHRDMVINSANLVAAVRSGSYGGTWDASLEIRSVSDFSLQHTASAATIDVASMALNTVVSFTLSGTEADKTVSPGEFLCLTFDLSAGVGGNLQQYVYPTVELAF